MKFISVDEAARRVGVHYGTILRARRDGRLTPYLQGRRARINEAELASAFPSRYPHHDAGKPVRRVHSIDAHIQALVESAPALSSEQAERLRALLREA